MHTGDSVPYMGYAQSIFCKDVAWEQFALRFARRTGKFADNMPNALLLVLLVLLVLLLRTLQRSPTNPISETSAQSCTISVPPQSK